MPTSFKSGAQIVQRLRSYGVSEQRLQETLGVTAHALGQMDKAEINGLLEIIGPRKPKEPRETTDFRQALTGLRASAPDEMRKSKDFSEDAEFNNEVLPIQAGLSRTWGLPLEDDEVKVGAIQTGLAVSNLLLPSDIKAERPGRMFMAVGLLRFRQIQIKRPFMPYLRRDFRGVKWTLSPREAMLEGLVVKPGTWKAIYVLAAQMVEKATGERDGINVSIVHPFLITPSGGYARMRSGLFQEEIRGLQTLDWENSNASEGGLRTGTAPQHKWLMPRLLTPGEIRDSVEIMKANESEELVRKLLRDITSCLTKPDLPRARYVGRVLNGGSAYSR